MAKFTNGMKIEKTSFHIKGIVFTKLFEFLENLNRAVPSLYIKSSPKRILINPIINSIDQFTSLPG